jgi:hypothetical protein
MKEKSKGSKDDRKVKFADEKSESEGDSVDYFDEDDD